MFIVQNRSPKTLKSLIQTLTEAAKRTTRRPSFYFVSFCPHKRAWARQCLKVRVLNPYEYRLWGTLRNGLMWLDEWPAFIGDSWRELRFLLLGQHHVMFFQQSFILKNSAVESTLFREAFSIEPHQLNPLERAKDLGVISFTWVPRLIIQRHFGEAQRGVLLLDRKGWPKQAAQEIFIPFCLWRASELLALAGRHRIVIMAATGRRSIRLWSLPESALCWLLSGQVPTGLINWGSENQGRRHPYSQSSLSRASCHWHAFVEKWSLSIGALLRWSRRGQKA